MKLRLRKNEVELVLAVLRERINLMKHAGISYTDRLAYMNTYHRLEDVYKKQVRRKEVRK